MGEQREQFEATPQVFTLSRGPPWGLRTQETTRRQVQEPRLAVLGCRDARPRSTQPCTSPNCVPRPRKTHVVDTHDHSGGGAATADLLQGDRVGQVIQASTTQLLWHIHGQQPELPHLLHLAGGGGVTSGRAASSLLPASSPAPEAEPVLRSPTPTIHTDRPPPAQAAPPTPAAWRPHLIVFASQPSAAAGNR